MTYNEIIKEIENGLTGDNEKDSKYLYELMDKYKDHKFSNEIIKELARMLFERLPEEARAELNNTINQELPFRKLIDEFDSLYMDRKPEKALVKIQEAVSIFEELNYFKEDEVNIYKDFNEFFEAVIFNSLYSPTKQIRDTGGIPLAEMYFKFGACLFELKKFKEAKNALKKSLDYNPISNIARFELAEVYKAEGDLNSFFNEIKMCYRHAYKRSDVAHAYRMLAYYFAEKEMFKEANVFITASLSYDPTNKVGISEADYIRYHLQNGELPLSDKFVNETSTKYNIPLTASDEILNIALAYKDYAEKNGYKDHVEYFDNIIKGMSN